MRILITGTGLLGCYTARESVWRGDDVDLLDVDPDPRFLAAVVQRDLTPHRCDILDLPELDRQLRRLSPEIVVHTAGALGGRFREDPAGSYAVNVVGSLAVAEAARRCGARRLIFISSLAVYRFGSEVDPIAEEDPVGPESLYDRSKLDAELALTALCNAVGLELVILRLAGVYGPGRFRGGAWMGRRVQELVRSSQVRRRVHLDAAELGTNEYLYVKDAASAVVAACRTTGSLPPVLNIGPGRLTTASEVADALAEVFPGVVIDYATPASAAPPTYLARRAPLAIDRARLVLGFRPAFPTFGDGLRDYATELARITATWTDQATFPMESADLRGQPRPASSASGSA